MLQTGLFTHRECSQHEMGSWHPECPERLAAISDHLIATGIAPHLKHYDAPLLYKGDDFAFTDLRSAAPR